MLISRLAGLESFNENKGQALVELVVGFGILIIVLGSVGLLLIGVRENRDQAANILTAQTSALMQAEAVRSVREGGWGNLKNGTYHVVNTGTRWSLVLGPETVSGLTRQINLASACRDNSNALVECPTGRVDPSTKKVTVTTSWASFFGGSVGQTFYLTRYLGNTTWQQTSDTDFLKGSTVCTKVTNTSGGEIQLLSAPVTNWKSLTIIASRDFPGPQDALDVFVSCGKAYLVTESRSGADFFIYDTTTGTSPTLLGSLDLGSTGHSVVVSENYAYIATSDDHRELTVVDVSDPTNPKLYGNHFDTPSSNSDARSVASSGSTVYLVTNNNTAAPGYEFYTIDVSNPVAPNLIGGTDLGSTTRDAFISGNFAYVASTSNTAELKVLNISNPAQPSVVGYYNTSGPFAALSVYVVDGTAYLAAGSNVYVLNVSNLPNINLVRTYGVGGTAYSVYVSGSLAFVANGQTGSQLKIIDLNVPGSSFIYSSINLGADALAVAIFNGYAYLASSANSAELQIVSGSSSVGFQNFGTYESPTFDAGANAGFNYLNWTAQVPAGTSLAFQIATNNNNATWNWVGPDGTNSTSYQNPASIPLSYVSGQYFRYKVTFTSGGNATPILQNTSVNYSP